MRRLEERQLLSDGWSTEWEPCADQPRDLDTDKEWTRHVALLNREEKKICSNIRYRSVEVEDA